MRHRIIISSGSVLTYAAIVISGLFFLVGCLALWLLQTVLELLAFPFILGFAVATLAYLFIQRKMRLSI
ncbi:MAG: hypothetical protein BGO55_23545 [Sphingobacteriales bacterium 50-39]|nr:MAG: hypothetical protein BGO55_23545 [Sphingobacteriales bacterium 50-39]